MTDEITAVELTSPHTEEIEEKPEDTPGSINGARKTLLAIATITQIFNASYAGVNDSFLSSRDMTGLNQEEVNERRLDLFEEQAIPAHEQALSDAQIANQSRLELLARLYVSSKLSAEEDARLAILTEKVRRLIPRVTSEDFEKLEAMAAESAEIRDRNAERRRRLGI
jgi:hypothetical protein